MDGKTMCDQLGWPHPLEHFPSYLEPAWFIPPSFEFRIYRAHLAADQPDPAAVEPSPKI
jgi:hypothetical protein